jgi:hypothetical protein
VLKVLEPMGCPKAQEVRAKVSNFVSTNFPRAAVYTAALVVLMHI